jgi:hypothetical protein
VIVIPNSVYVTILFKLFSGIDKLVENPVPGFSNLVYNSIPSENFAHTLISPIL